MSSNSMTDYVEAFRANLPAGITFDATLNRYFCNDKRYLNEWEVEAYLNYIKKFGFTAISAYAILNLEPPLVLDFDETFYRTGGTATDLVSAATHARASAATYVDADGILQTAAINEPRVGHYIYNGSAWVDEGYFHESEARTNLVTYSQDFTDAYWSKANTDTLAIDGTGPDGETSAVTLVDSGLSGSNQVRVDRGITVSASTTYTFSCFAKADQLDWVQLFPFAFTTPADGRTYFNLSTGSIGTVASGHTANIQDFGNGWYRCSITFTTDASDTFGQLAIQLAESDGGVTVSLDGTSSVLIYGAQFEAGSTPSSYIPTSGSTVTRAADTLTIPSANLPWPTEAPLAVSIQMEGTMTGSSSTFASWTEDVSNGILMQSGASDFTFTQEAAGTVDTVTGGSYTSGINVTFNIASRHGSTFINGAVDGTALTANTTPTALPDLSSTDMQIGSTFMGTIKLFRVWAEDLTDEGIAEASSNA